MSGYRRHRSDRQPPEEDASYWDGSRVDSERMLHRLDEWLIPQPTATTSSRPREGGGRGGCDFQPQSRPPATSRPSTTLTGSRPSTTKTGMRALDQSARPARRTRPNTCPAASSPSSPQADAAEGASKPRAAQLCERVEITLQKLEAQPSLSDPQRQELRFEIYREAWGWISREYKLGVQSLHCRVQGEYDERLAELHRKADDSAQSACQWNTRSKDFGKIVKVHTKKIGGHNEKIQRLESQFNNSEQHPICRQRTDAVTAAKSARDKLIALQTEKELIAKAVEQQEDRLRIYVLDMKSKEDNIARMRPQVELTLVDIDGCNDFMEKNVAVSAHEQIIADKNATSDWLDNEEIKLTEIIENLNSKIDGLGAMPRRKMSLEAKLMLERGLCLSPTSPGGTALSPDPYRMPPNSPRKWGPTTNRDSIISPGSDGPSSPRASILSGAPGSTGSSCRNSIKTQSGRSNKSSPRGSMLTPGSPPHSNRNSMIKSVMGAPKSASPPQSNRNSMIAPGSPIGSSRSSTIK